MKSSGTSPLWSSLAPEGVQGVLLWYLDYLELKTLEKQQIQGESCTESSCLPKERAAQRRSVVIHPLHGRFNNRGRLTLVPGQKTRSGQHTHTNSVTNDHTSHLLLRPIRLS